MTTITLQLPEEDFLLALAREKVDSFAVDLEDLRRELPLG